MPLSEHEQRLLEQMEQAFYEEDPDFASAMQRPRVPLGRRLGLAIALGLGGLAVIIAALAAQVPVLGVLGFVALVAAASMVIGRERKGGERPARPRRSMTDKMNERWDRRRER